MYVLIVTVWVYYYGSSTAMHDFSSQSACELARDAYIKEMGKSDRVHAICVPK